MSQSEALYPSVAPENEIELPNDPSFAAACMASIADHVEKHGLCFGNSILTRHGHWGLVWRVDILRKHESAPSTLSSRYVCWRPSDMEDGIGGTAYLIVKEEDRIR